MQKPGPAMGRREYHTLSRGWLANEAILAAGESSVILLYPLLSLWDVVILLWPALSTGK